MVTVILGLFILVKDVMEETFMDGMVIQEMDLQSQQSKVLLQEFLFYQNLHYINQDMLDDISFDWEGIIDAIILLTPDGKESWCWVLHKIKSLML